MLNNKTFLKIISLLIAVALWIYVMGEVNPDTEASIQDVEITFTNTDSLAGDGLAVVQNKTVTVDITIQGRRAEVNETKRNGVTATVDVEGASEGKNTREINVILPDGVSLAEISRQSLTFTAEELVEEEKPVTIEIAGAESAAGSLMPWVIDSSPKTVTVTGAKSSVERISEVRGTVPRNSATERQAEVEVDLAPVTDDNEVVLGVALSRETATASVQLLYSRAVNLEISVENLPDGMETERVEAPDTVTILGTEDAVNSIDSLEGTVDLSGAASGEKIPINIDLPEGTYLYYREGAPAAEVTLRTAD